MTNTLTGQVNSYAQYRHTQKDEGMFMDDDGQIDYDLILGSGTGIAQINKVWYASDILNTSGSLDLFDLEFSRFGFAFTQNFFGASSGNIKSIKIENSSSAEIGVRLPFANFNHYLHVPGSGSLVLSNTYGWEIASTGAVIQLSGDGTDQIYNISLLGASLPISLNVDGIIPVEYAGSTVFDSVVSFEYLGVTDILTDAEIPIEWDIPNSGTG
jgi:hypothetical protein